MSTWIPLSKKLPPEGQVVLTKIDDDNGARNEAPLKRRGNLWFVEDGSMYVYLLSALKELLAVAAAELHFQPSHTGPCGPDAGCDAECMSIASVSRIFWKANAAISQAEGRAA